MLQRKYTFETHLKDMTFITIPMINKITFVKNCFNIEGYIPAIRSVPRRCTDPAVWCHECYHTKSI